MAPAGSTPGEVAPDPSSGDGVTGGDLAELAARDAAETATRDDYAFMQGLPPRWVDSCERECVARMPQAACRELVDEAIGAAAIHARSVADESHRARLLATLLRQPLKMFCPRLMGY